MTDVQKARIEAAARVLPCFWPDSMEGHPAHEMCVRCRENARAVLAAADAVVTVEQITETIDRAEKSTRTGSKPHRQRIVAAAIQRLYRGEETSND